MRAMRASEQRQRPRPLLVWLGAVVWAAALVGVTFSPSLSWMVFFRATRSTWSGNVWSQGFLSASRGSEWCRLGHRAAAAVQLSR